MVYLNTMMKNKYLLYKQQSADCDYCVHHKWLQPIASNSFKNKAGNLKAHNYTTKSISKMTLSDHEMYNSDIP